MHMNSICIIPARGGSKSVPGKNIRMLCGKPLIAHSIETALSSNIFKHVIVSTDDLEIAKIARQYGAETPFMRPSKLADDVTSNDDVLIHAIKQLKSSGFNFEISVLRDCTVPFITEDELRKGLELLTSSDCDAVFGAIRAHPNPYFGMMEKNSSGYLLPSKSVNKLITRRQDAPVVYNVEGFFMHYVKNLLTVGNILTSKILPYEISKDHGIMIDYEIDFEIAEILMSKKTKTLTSLNETNKKLK